MARDSGVAVFPMARRSGSLISGDDNQARGLRGRYQGARFSQGYRHLAREAGKAGFSDGTTLWFVDNTNDEAVAYLASDQSRQSADDITHADLAGNLLVGGVYANGIAWFVEPEADTAVAFVQDVSKTYIGSTQINKAYIGSTAVSRAYLGSTRVF